MVRKIIFCFVFFYVLLMIQTSFLVCFKIWGMVPNLVLIAVVLISLLSQNQLLGMGSALIGGFYLDVFSLSTIGFFGFYTLILLLFSIIARIILQKYVRIPLFKRI